MIRKDGEVLPGPCPKGARPAAPAPQTVPQSSPWRARGKEKQLIKRLANESVSEIVWKSWNKQSDHGAVVLRRA